MRWGDATSARFIAARRICNAPLSACKQDSCKVAHAHKPICDSYMEGMSRGRIPSRCLRMKSRHQRGRRKGGRRRLPAAHEQHDDSSKPLEFAAAQ